MRVTPGKLRELVNAMTRDRLVVGGFRSDALDDQVEQFREMMTAGAGRPIWAVATLADDDGVARSVAITGNGPTGRANAQGIAALHAMAPALVDLWEACERERAALPDDVRLCLAQVEVFADPRVPASEAAPVPPGAPAAELRLGDIVTVNEGTKIGRPHVVVHEPVNDRVQLCYCGTGRWYVPEWHPIGDVSTRVADTRELRRCRRLLAAVKPGPDGWKRIEVGRYGQTQTVIVGHVDVPWSWPP